MLERLADRPQRTDPPAGPSVKHPFDRDPLLIPQLFVDGKPWHRRRDTMLKLVALIASLAFAAIVVRQYGLEGVLRRLARLAPR